MATQLGPINVGAIINRVRATGIVSRPTMYHPGAVNPIERLQRGGFIAGPTTAHPPGPVTGGNKRRP